MFKMFFKDVLPLELKKYALFNICIIEFTIIPKRYLKFNSLEILNGFLVESPKDSCDVLKYFLITVNFDLNVNL